MKPNFFFQICKSEIIDEHLTYCSHINSESDLRYEHLLNGTLPEKVKVLEQIEFYEKIRKKELKK